MPDAVFIKRFSCPFKRLIVLCENDEFVGICGRFQNHLVKIIFRTNIARFHVHFKRFHVLFRRKLGSSYVIYISCIRFKIHIG